MKIIVEKEIIQVSEIQIKNGTKLSLYEGDKTQLQVQVLPEDADDKLVQYTVDDDSVATTSQDGYVEAIKEGTTKVHVTSSSNSSVTATIEIEVLNQQHITLPKFQQKPKHKTFGN